MAQCEELHKILRRQEKRFLNESLNLYLRFPLPKKVSNSIDKVYILLQSAVSNINIQDFSLRIEQSDVCEKALRLLAALKEQAINNFCGCLLLNVVYLDRSLRTKSWNIKQAGSIFSNCPGVRDSIVNSLIQSNILDSHDIIGISSSQIQHMCSCTSYEADSLIMYGHIWNNSKMVTNASISSTHQLIIDVVPCNPDLELDHYYPSINSFDNSKKDVYPTFELICYHEPTAMLLCYRRIPQGLAAKHQYTVPIDKSFKIDDVVLLLISSIVGLDFYFMSSKASRTTFNQILSIDDECSNDKTIKSILPNAKKRKRGTVSVSSKLKKNSQVDDSISIQVSPTNNLHSYGYFPVKREAPKVYDDKMVKSNSIQSVG